MKNNLFIQPFERYRESTLFYIGLSSLVIGSLIAHLCNTRFDGVLDVHSGSVTTWKQPFVDNLINVISLFIPLFILGYSINAKSRVIDILTTILIARLPIYLITLFNINGKLDEITSQVLKSLNKGQFSLPWTDTSFLILTGILGLLALIYSITLLFNGFKIATNSKKTTHIIWFAICILLAEVISKLLISHIAY